MLVVAAVLAPAAAHAQLPASGWDRLLPHDHYFRPLIADVQEPRMSLGMLETDVFAHAPEGRERPPFTLPDPQDAASDVEVSAGIGGSIPLWWLKQWPGKGGLVGVGMPIEFQYDRWSGRFRIMHRSSHLGDELIQISHAQRIEFGGEFADFIAAYRFADDARVYGGATYNFRSYTRWVPVMRRNNREDYGQLQAGVDGTWYKWADGHFGLIAGADWQAQQRTNWRSIVSVAAGPGIQTNGRATRLLVRYYHGPSSMGEFFLTPETFWTVEWVVDF